MRFLARLAIALVLVSCGDTGRGPQRRQLTVDPAEDRAPAWSPKGTRLLFASDRDGDFEIYVMGFDGRSQRRLTYDPASDRSPAWSPTGTRFVFESDRGGTNGLWIADLATGEAEHLLTDASPELVPDWSPDGDWIAFTSERDGNLELYRIRVTDRLVERLTDNPYRDLWPRYAPDGSHLVFFSRRGTRGDSDDLYRLDLDSREVVRLTEHPRHHDFTPDYGPDGVSIVASMSNRAKGWRELRLHTPNKEPLGFAPGYHRVFQPAWSPRGCEIAYAARVRDGAAADIYVERVTGRPQAGC